MGKKRKKIWLATPPCLFWTLWCERNMVVFENEISSVQRIKATFLSNLWYWANLYSFDNTNSLVDFFVLDGVSIIKIFCMCIGSNRKGTSGRPLQL